jgi:ABC-2 type transport system permease protein
MADGGEHKTATSGAQRARVIERVAMSTSTLLLVAIVLMVNYLAYRHYQRLDWTSDGMFTLSPKSLSVLRELDQDVDLYVFMSRGEPDYMKIDELIRRYEAASQKLKVHHVDPDREPAEFKVLAQRFGIGAGMTHQGEAVADVAAVVVRGDKNWHVGREDLIGFDFGGPEQKEQVSVKAEQALTGAIVQVISGRPTKVCVTRGHGEWNLEDGTERSLATLKTGLRHDNIEWEAFETLGEKAVPEGCDALFVLGPQRAFSDAEAKLVIDYVQGGGNALLMLDPVIEHDRILPTGFEEPLKGLGVKLEGSLAVELDEKRLLSPNPLEFAVTEFGDHETTRPLRGSAYVVMGLVRSLSVLEETDRVEPLLRTSPKAFGATDISRVMAGGGQEPARGPGDLAGPLDIAFAVRAGRESDEAGDKLGGRLIVVGDSDFLSPALLEAPQLANFHLASAWTGFLTQRRALIEIPPKKVRGGEIVFTQDGLNALFFRVGVLLPGAALLFGFAVWWNRRG